MNQGIAFARTLRALEADDFRTSRLALLAVAALLAVWVWWSVAATVPQYEAAMSVQLAPDGAITADFPAGAAGRIHAGQPALVHTNAAALPAQVARVSESNGRISVALAFLSSPQSPIPSPNEVRSVEVEVARVSPATLALRFLSRRHP